MFPIGLEEDFNAWKEGFAKAVFPVLLGEVSMTKLISSDGSTVKDAGSCGCGGQKTKDCCKEKTIASTDQVLNMIILLCS